MKDTKKVWRKKCREYLAVAFGGKCTVCGYDKIISALDYHHVDANSKDKELSIAMRNGYAWSRIVEEAKKCTLVCCRCHREIHAGVTELPVNYATFNKDYEDIIKLKKAEFDECPICNQEKNKRQQYCSVKCRGLSQRCFDITKEELEILILEKNYEEIAKIYNVTGNAIKKRCKVFGIKVVVKRGPRKRKDLGVSKEEFETMLKTMSVNAIAKNIGFGHTLVKNTILEYGIKIPDINWNKIVTTKKWKNKNM